MSDNARKPLDPTVKSMQKFSTWSVATLFIVKGLPSPAKNTVIQPWAFQFPPTQAQRIESVKFMELL